MQEDFIHYLWKHTKFDQSDLKTTKGQTISIASSGIYNHDAGPDFFNAQIAIGDQLWAGNVEMHLKSSDWFVHGHETDKAYDNVILHVVWEHDTEIFRGDNTEIETLELKTYVSNEALNNYKALFSKQQKWINCESDFKLVDNFLLSNWLERLYFERLERKSETINTMLQDSKNDWEAVLFKMLAKNFGLKVNGESFLSIAGSFDFSILRKESSKREDLEALLFGQAGLLYENKEDAYFIKQKNTYNYQKSKYQLNDHAVLPVQFFRLRPPNFPSIRLSQLASLYHTHKTLFSEIIRVATKEEMYEVFHIAASKYWDTHFVFGKTSKKSKKKMTSAFIDLLLINTIIPLKFSYAKHIGKLIDDEIVQWITQLKLEKNSVVGTFNAIKPVFNNALHSQALIQLKSEYCDKNKCLQCAIGNAILSN